MSNENLGTWLKE